MRLRIFAMSFAALTFASAIAYNVRGVVVDEERQPMIQAAVRVLNVKDSTAVKGVMTSTDGRFNIKDVPNGKYLLETSYVGYGRVFRNITVKGASLNVDTIAMTENTSVLKDLTVTGIKTPVKVMEDTIEYNADSYKTQPNAVVEDLLKRLPGVEVDTDGGITANGKTVTKILVEGKEFFSDDPKVASKNLPVDMIDKLQVVDRKSDLARLTGVDDGEDETVINLTVKKGMKNGWFGTLEGGYGTDDRYQGQFNINRFINDNQITFIGGANNTNNMGFSDGGSRFSRFGGNSGITTSQSLGVNFNVGHEEIFRVGGDVMYSHTDRDAWRKSDVQYLFTDSTSFYNSERSSRDKGHNLRADFRMEWKPDSFNTIEFRPNFAFNFNDSQSDEISNTFAGTQAGTQGDQVNASINSQLSHGKAYDVGGRLIYNRKIASHPGRSFSVHAEYKFSNQKERENTYSWNRFYSLLMSDDPYDIYDQYADNHTWSNTVSSRVTWTEPLGNPAKGNFLTLAYRFQYRWNDADKLTYDRPLPDTQDVLDGLYIPEHYLGLQPGDVLLDSLSNRFRNDYMNQDIQLGYQHVSRKVNLRVGVSLVPQMMKSEDLIDSNKSIPKRTTWNFAPFMRYRLKFSSTRSFNMFYNGRSSQPSMTQLQPVADYSNPLNVKQGNPNLDPSFTHSMRLRFQDFNQDAQRSIMVAADASVTQNSIISRTRFDSTTGGRFTTYENVNGVWSANAFSMISFPFRNKKFTFNNHLGGMYNHNVGYTSVSREEYVRNNSGSLTINESFGVAFRPDNLELELRPNYRLQYVTNSVQKSSNQTVHRYGGTFNGTYYTPFGLVLSTDLRYSANRGYAEGYNTNEWMWNATISYMTLRDKSLTISLRASDILNQRSNLSRSVSDNSITDQLTNSLTRYVMVGLTYKFNTFGKGREPEMRDNGREGGREGGRGPGGPGGFGGQRRP